MNSLRAKIEYYLEKIDVSFVALILILFILGLLNLISVTHNNPNLSHLWKTQTLWFSISLVAFLITSFIRPSTYSRFAYPLYIATNLLLVGVLLFGQVGMGAQRWLSIGPFRLQPSEFSKLSLILALAKWFSHYSPVKGLKTKDLLIPGLITLVPTLLIRAQPDLGTSLILVFIFGVLIFFRRLPLKPILTIVILAIVGGTTVYHFGGLKDYQKKRVLSFLNPEEYALGAGYNAIQSKIAIGSGQVWGKGYQKSTQASLKFLPENHTDFVFSVLSEEHGFLGAVIVIALFGFLIYRLLLQASLVMDLFASTVSVGIAALFFFHVFVNMGMVMGLLPVVGLPLPYMSYGGSSLLTFGLAIGIATSMSRTRGIF